MNGLPYIRRHFDFSPYVDLLNDRFADVPEHTVHLEKGNALSSVGTEIQPHLMPELNGLLDVVFDLCSIFYEDITPEASQDYITRSWMNRHLRTGETTEHSHGGAEFVMSCYVTVPEASGNFEMFYEGKWHTIPVNGNDILVFPGTVLHRTEVSASDEPRIVITLNLTRQTYVIKHGISPMFDENNIEKSMEEMSKRFFNSIGDIADATAKIEMQLLELE